MSKEKHSILRLLTKFTFLFPYALIVIKEFTALIKYEALMATKSLCTVIIFSVLFGGLLFSLWLGLLVLLVMYLISLQWSVQEAIVTVLGINFLLLLISGFIIAKAKKQLLFRETRKKIFKKKKSSD